MLIRAAQLADMTAVARVNVDSWRTTYRGIVPDDYLANRSYDERAAVFGKSLTQEGVIFFVAEDEADGIVGFASAGPERTGNPEFRGELYAVYLLDHHQRHGIGADLVARVAESLRAAGFNSMLVWVLATNPACRFYERLGGTRIRTQTITIGGVSLEEVAYGWRGLAPLLLADRAGRRHYRA